MRDKKRVLLMEDSASMRMLTAYTLENEGFEVDQATSGEQGLSIAFNSRVNIIVTDLNMPGMDGIEVIREIRKLPGYKFVPIIMLTTEAHEESKRKGKEAGASAWITKPYSPMQLVSTVNTFLKETP